MNKKILIVDFALIGSSGGGHSEAYFLNFVSILIRNNYEVYACCANNQRLREKLEEQGLINQCTVIDFHPLLPEKLLFRGWKIIDWFLEKIPNCEPIKFTSLYNLLAVKRLFKQLGEEIPVFFAHVDSMIPAVPTLISKRFMPKKWSGLYVIPSYKGRLYFSEQARKMRFYKEKNFSLSSCQAILVLHPLYRRFLKKRIKELNSIDIPELVEIPELKDSNQEPEINEELLHQIKQLVKGRKIISFLGNITLRKNILLFLESASLLDPEKYFILVLGRLKGKDKPEVAAQLNQIQEYQKLLTGNSYIDLDYFITNETEFSRLVSLSDVIFLHYQKFPYSSNMLTRAMAHRKPVIVNKGYVMEKTVKTYNWREAVESNPHQIAKSMEELSAPTFSIEEHSYQSFISNHSPEAFEASTLKAVNNLYQ